MKQVGRKERETSLRQSGAVPHTKRDIVELNNVNRNKKYEVEKSRCYIGYKLLWIMKLYLEGRMFPYGSLSQDKWEKNTTQIVNLIL